MEVLAAGLTNVQADDTEERYIEIFKASGPAGYNNLPGCPGRSKLFWWRYSTAKARKAKTHVQTCMQKGSLTWFSPSVRKAERYVWTEMHGGLDMYCVASVSWLRLRQWQPPLHNASGQKGAGSGVVTIEVQVQVGACCL